ncbi:DUF3854 domain-containing protein [Caulifigura coniformis]|nr:DUF3854 domain-containing protein [Caulifigura coniformis]
MAAPFVSLFVTEGEKKACALAQDGAHVVVSIPGVWNGCKKGKEELIDDLRELVSPGLPIYIVFDFDPKPETRAKVDAAKRRLARAFVAAGAGAVLSVNLPPASDGGKQGVDDFLVDHGPEAFERLVADATPVDTSEPEPDGKSSRRAGNDFVRRLGLGPLVELWLDENNDAFATVMLDGRLEHWQIDKRNRPFRNWLSLAFYDMYGEVLTASQLSDYASLLCGLAMQRRKVYPVHLRTAAHDGVLYLDLCNANREVVAVTSEGYSVLSACPVKFRRTRAMLELPRPVPTARSVRELLRPFLNIRPEQEPLLIAFVTAAMRPVGPYPIPKLQGEQGVGKTTLARMLRALIDPNAAPLRVRPQSERDLMIMSHNAWMLGFDNLSAMLDWMSDALCVLSTGGAFSSRELYSNNEEVIFKRQCPVLVTSIGEVGTNSDLLDRCLIFELQPIPEEERQTDKKFWANFEAVRAEIFGAILDVIVAGMRRLPEIEQRQSRDLSRMADFCQWGAAIEEAIGLDPGDFAAAYRDNRELATATALEGSPIVAPLLRMLRVTPLIELSASDLLDELNSSDSSCRMIPGWPKKPQLLSGILNRIAPNLRQIGVTATPCTIGSGNAKRKVWRIESSLPAEPKIVPIPAAAGPKSAFAARMEAKAGRLPNAG